MGDEPASAWFSGAVTLAMGVGPRGRVVASRINDRHGEGDRDAEPDQRQ
jgi:hypothetical protein